MLANKNVDNSDKLVKNLSSTTSPSCTSSSLSSAASSSTSSNFRASYLNEINSTKRMNIPGTPNSTNHQIPAKKRYDTYLTSSSSMENILNELDKNTNSWVPPNDRELIMRARLKTGWSSRSNNIMQSSENNNKNNSHIVSNQMSGKPNQSYQNHGGSISESEFQEIEQVMLRATLIEHKEIDRINKLYQRYNSMNRPQGNGETSCLICNSFFGILSSTPRICSDCFKNVCSTCSVDALSSSKQTTIWLCKICAEYRDFLKKSGAWFNKRLPNGIIITPASSNDAIKNNSNLSPAKINIKDTTNLIDNNNNASLNLKKLDDNFENQDQENYLQNNTTLSKYGNKNPNDVYDADDEYNTKKSSTTNGNNHNKDFKDTLFGEITAINKNTSHIVTDDSKLNFELENQLIQEQVAASRKPSIALNGSSTLITDNNNDRKNSNAILTRPWTSSSDSILKLSEIENKATELGSIQFSVEYIAALLKLKIHLISGMKLPSKDSNGLSDPYVKLHLLPGIAKATKLRSRTVYKNLNPQFNEVFHYEGVTNEDLDQKILRLTVLDEDKFGFDFIGEYRLPLKTILRNEINQFNVPLEEKQEFGDEADTNFRGKINFAIKYSKNTNCLFVKINRCTQLIPMDNGKTSDPFVEISLVPFQKENKQKFKSTVKWKTLDPEFLEEFKFTNIDLKTLLTKTIEISVWDKDFRKNDFIGQVQLGQQRTGEELKHFFTMIKNPDLYHEQWHTLHLKENGDSELD